MKTFKPVEPGLSTLYLKHTHMWKLALLPVSGSQSQSLQVEVQPLVLGCLQRPGAGSVLGGIRSMMGRRGQHPPYCGILYCSPTKSYEEEVTIVKINVSIETGSLLHCSSTPTHLCSWAPCRSTLAGRRWGRWAAAPPAGGNPCGSESGRCLQGAGPALTPPQSEAFLAADSSAWRLHAEGKQGGECLCTLWMNQSLNYNNISYHMLKRHRETKMIGW